MNVYFPVTIKNTSPDLEESWIEIQVTNAQQGESSTATVSDGDIGTPSVRQGGYLPLGESLSVKDGWTMATLDGVEYSLRIDGLSGDTVRFTR
ncbi:hypothetical protein CH282_15895 [Rhodococcus sp. 06-418-1B]|nr:hypothetical protein CH282_15895 [Rhodococcus sp. 06-418-1B]